MKKELTSQDVKFNFKFIANKEKGSVTMIPEIDVEYEKIGRALNISQEGYNIYLIDSFSKEKLKKLQSYIREQYKFLEPPNDICYVVLDDYKRPEVLFVSNGNGNKLKDAVDRIRNNYIELVEEFYNSSTEDEKDELIDEIQNKRNSYISELMEMAKKDNFEVKVTNKGFAFIPLINGKVISEREYDNLEKEKKEVIVAKATVLKKKAEVVLGKIKDIEIKSITKLKEVYSDFLTKEMEAYKDEVLFEFIDDDNAYEYLEKLFILMEKNIIECYTMDIEDDEEKLYDIINNYNIHLLVDNSLTNQPPVIYDEDPSVNNLMGFLEYENHNGVYTTDISLINSGSLLKANGGCLIIRMNSLINNGYSYYHLKKALMTNKITYDASKSYLDIISINSLKPQPIPINVKVILIGDMNTYDTLYNLDEDFGKLFPLRAEFDPIVDANENAVNYVNHAIDNKIKENNLMQITEEGRKEIIKYLARTATRKTKINIDIAEIDKVMILANYNAKTRNSELIEGDDIRKFAYYKEKIEEEYDKLYKENKIILSVTGEKIGVINGLSVLDTGYHSFGKPVRITCIAHKGTGRIIDIHKESKLSGKIHEKSINVIRGLISSIIDSYEGIPVDFYLNFEQSYGIIDGDSASVAEVICMLSALTKRPINQSISVTGSINQLGEVQAIGGVNEKIEGYFKVCEYIDNYKNKGVLIPSSNKDELILMPEVEKAIEDGDFHIYTMDTLDNAIETLILKEGETLEDFYSTLKEEIKKYKTKK
ncbi:AAA family ATPase [Clostridium sp. AL.422]|uniref:AAA family ATPase n=1 Tax=Clostridium TaxID=1485 RepID=UPI00293DF3E4|nr:MULTISPECIES: AAA family ATPase [unclassified Clostridium]MDV4150079.1 AAA family ATPase [Clostridium sp. AL.422]